MKAVGDIRLDNLEKLIERFGTLAAIAEAAGTSSVYLSQIRNRTQDSKTLRPREMGASMARRIEAGLGLPSAWMDGEHSNAEAKEQLPAVLSAAAPRVAAATTIGQVAMAIGAAVAGLSESRRKTISVLVAAQIADKPDQQEADAIDALAHGLTIESAPGWREILHGYIEALDSGPDRDLLEAVFAAVDAKHSELAHRKDAKLVGKITHPLGG